MNSNADAFVSYILNESPRHQKRLVEVDASSKFHLVQDGKVYHNDCFTVRFCYSKKSSPSFSNTVLALSVLEKYDRIPFFVVLVRKEADNLILLANSTFLKKISHSSATLATNNIRGSFNGSDIIRNYNGISNTPNHFDELNAIHLGMEWKDNLERLVEATRGIAPRATRFAPDEEDRKIIHDSVNRAICFVESPDYTVLLEDLNSRCRNCENEIKIAAHIENNNIRGRLIESLITADKDERERLLRDMADVETQLPLYDSRNSLGDYIVHFRNHDVHTDIKTKIIYLNSNPKAYNIDKFLRLMAEDKSVFMFFFIGIDEHGLLATKLCSVYHSSLLNNTLLQFHWSGRASRGVAQFSGTAINNILQSQPFGNEINRHQAEQFLNTLLER